jgi:hypothetical protein
VTANLQIGKWYCWVDVAKTGCAGPLVALDEKLGAQMEYPPGRQSWLKPGKPGQPYELVLMRWQPVAA